MKILFLGGTSFFGKLILEALIRWDYDVTFVTRGNNRPKNILARHVCGDCRNPETLEKLRALGPWDLLIDNIAFNATDVKSALSLNPGHYFLTSSIAVYEGIGPIRPDRQGVVSPYAMGKRDADLELISQDIPWTIFRLGIVYGPGDPLNRWRWYMEPLLRTSELAFHDSSARLSFVFSDDIPYAYLEAVRRLNRMNGKVFDLAQDEQITNREYIMAHCQFFEKIPIQSAHSPLVGHEPYHYDRDFVARSTTPAKELLGWKPTPWLEAVKRTAPWFKKQIEGKHENFESHP